MKIKTRDDLSLLLSLCDMCVKLNGLNTSPRVYKMADECKQEIQKLPDVPVPMTGEQIADVERQKHTKRITTGDDLN